MNLKSIIFFRLLLFFPLSVAAPWLAQKAAADTRLYRCRVDGVVEFRQTGCRGGEEAVVNVVESSRGMTPAEPGVRLKKRPGGGNTVERKSGHDEQDRACWKRRRQLLRIEGKLRAGYRASQYRRLHERREEHESYLRRFCP